MRIGCGNCGGQHDSVNDIRLCYDGKLKVGGVKTEETATTKQLNMAHMLARQRERLTDYAAMEQDDYEDMIQAMGRRTISRFIQAMLEQPKLNKESIAWELPRPEVPGGRYALERDGKVYFYQVFDGDETRPRNLVSLHGSPGGYSYTTVRSSKRASEIMDAIAANIMEALVRYGLESGVCGLCSSPLTNEQSRAIGIGPICRDKL